MQGTGESGVRSLAVDSVRVRGPRLRCAMAGGWIWSVTVALTSSLALLAVIVAVAVAVAVAVTVVVVALLWFGGEEVRMCVEEVGRGVGYFSAALTVRAGVVVAADDDASAGVLPSCGALSWRATRLNGRGRPGEDERGWKGGRRVFGEAEKEAEEDG